MAVKNLIYCKLKYLLINKMPQLTAKQQKLPEGLKKAILAKKAKAPAKKAPAKSKMSPRVVRKAPKANY
jgi:hypothetical protein